MQLLLLCVLAMVKHWSSHGQALVLCASASDEDLSVRPLAIPLQLRASLSLIRWCACTCSRLAGSTSKGAGGQHT